MVLVIVFIILFALMMAVKSPKMGVKRCWDAPPGEAKIHRWIVQDVPGSKQLILICKVCGQRPGEE